jgi:hypothetical protein
MGPGSLPELFGEFPQMGQTRKSGRGEVICNGASHAIKPISGIQRTTSTTQLPLLLPSEFVTAYECEYVPAAARFKYQLKA